MSQVVFTTDSGKLTRPSAEGAGRESIEALQKLPDVTGVPDRLAEGGAVSEDGRTAFTTVQYDRQSVDMETDDGKAFEKAARDG